LQENIQPIYYPSPGASHHSGQQLTEDEQIKIAKRIGLIQHLPIHQYTDDNFKAKKIPSECDICMNDFVVGTYESLSATQMNNFRCLEHESRLKINICFAFRRQHSIPSLYAPVSRALRRQLAHALAHVSIVLRASRRWPVDLVRDHLIVRLKPFKERETLFSTHTHIGHRYEMKSDTEKS